MLRFTYPDSAVPAICPMTYPSAEIYSLPVRLMTAGHQTAFFKAFLGMEIIFQCLEINPFEFEVHEKYSQSMY